MPLKILDFNSLIFCSVWSDWRFNNIFEEKPKTIVVITAITSRGTVFGLCKKAREMIIGSATTENASNLSQSSIMNSVARDWNIILL